MTFFYDVIFEKIRQKIKIKDLFAKLQTLEKTHVPFLTTVIDFVYENYPKLFFYGVTM